MIRIHDALGYVGMRRTLWRVESNGKEKLLGWEVKLQVSEASRSRAEGCFSGGREALFPFAALSGGSIYRLLTVARGAWWPLK